MNKKNVSRTHTLYNYGLNFITVEKEGRDNAIALRHAHIMG